MMEMNRRVAQSTTCLLSFIRTTKTWVRILLSLNLRRDSERLAIFVKRPFGLPGPKMIEHVRMRD